MTSRSRSSTACATEADLYGREEFEALAQETPELPLRPGAVETSRRAAHWAGERGFVHEVARRVYDGMFEGQTAYLCGPPPMIEACIGALMQGRLFEKHIFTERFLTAKDARSEAEEPAVQEDLGMAPQRFQITLEGHGVANGYANERVLVALERAQGFGQLKEHAAQPSGRLPPRRLWDLPGARARRRLSRRPDEPRPCFGGERGRGRRAVVLHLSAFRSCPAAGDAGRSQSKG